MKRHGIDRRIDAPGAKKSRHARCETESIGELGVIERLDSQPIAGEGHASAVALPARAGEHARDPLEAALAPGEADIQNDLGIAEGEETIAPTLQLRAQVGRDIARAV